MYFKRVAIGNPFFNSKTMASIKYSALISEMRGKLNGTVFSRNHYAAYARNKVTPYNPRTDRQQKIRAVFAELSKTWRLLHQEQRDAWNQAVYNFLRTNIFGDTYKPSGINLFIRINMNLHNVRRDRLLLPPKPAPVDSIKIILIEIDATNNSITIIIESLPGITHIPILSVTRPLSPGIYFVKSEFRILDFSYNVDPINPLRYYLKIGPQYVEKFGTLPNFVGQIFFVKVLPIDSHTGLNGIPIQERVIIH